MTSVESFEALQEITRRYDGATLPYWWKIPPVATCFESFAVGKHAYSNRLSKKSTCCAFFVLHIDKWRNGSGTNAVLPKHLGTHEELDMFRCHMGLTRSALMSQLLLFKKTYHEGAYALAQDVPAGQTHLQRISERLGLDNIRPLIESVLDRVKTMPICAGLPNLSQQVLALDQQRRRYTMAVESLYNRPVVCGCGPHAQPCWYHLPEAAEHYRNLLVDWIIWFVVTLAEYISRTQAAVASSSTAWDKARSEYLGTTMVLAQGRRSCVGLSVQEASRLWRAIERAAYKECTTLLASVEGGTIRIPDEGKDGPSPPPTAQQAAVLAYIGGWLLHCLTKKLLVKMKDEELYRFFLGWLASNKTTEKVAEEANVPTQMVRMRMKVSPASAFFVSKRFFIWLVYVEELCRYCMTGGKIMLHGVELIPKLTQLIITDPKSRRLFLLTVLGTGFSKMLPGGLEYREFMDAVMRFHAVAYCRMRARDALRQINAGVAAKDVSKGTVNHRALIAATVTADPAAKQRLIKVQDELATMRAAIATEKAKLKSQVGPAVVDGGMVLSMEEKQDVAELMLAMQAEMEDLSGVEELLDAELGLEDGLE